MAAVGQRAVRVNGLDGLIRAFNAADKDVKTDLIDTLRSAAGPVAADARTMAGSRIPKMGGASRPWAQMRVGGSKVIWVAPVERGRSSKRRSRRNLANLMMDRALQPALDQNIGRVEKAVEELLDDIANVWERTH